MRGISCYSSVISQRSEETVSSRDEIMRGADFGERCATFFMVMVSISVIFGGSLSLLNHGFSLNALSTICAGVLVISMIITILAFKRFRHTSNRDSRTTSNNPTLPHEDPPPKYRLTWRKEFLQTSPDHLRADLEKALDMELEDKARRGPIPIIWTTDVDEVRVHSFGSSSTDSASSPFSSCMEDRNTFDITSSGRSSARHASVTSSSRRGSVRHVSVTSSGGRSASHASVISSSRRNSIRHASVTSSGQRSASHASVTPSGRNSARHVSIGSSSGQISASTCDLWQTARPSTSSLDDLPPLLKSRWRSTGSVTQPTVTYNPDEGLPSYEDVQRWS